MRRQLKIAMVAVLIAALLVGTPLLGCGGGGEGKTVITIGEITDLTGPASYAMGPLHYALLDLVRYVNEEDPIPGVQLKVATFDCRYDASRSVPGYDWLRGHGAKVILSGLDSDAEVLKSFAERDKVPVYSLTTSLPLIEPPGWAFCGGCRAPWQTKTVLKWIGDHWDYTKGVPKIGAIGSNLGFSVEMQQAVKEYCQDNPDKFEFVGGYQAPLATTLWSGVTKKLKDCDWIFDGVDGTAMANFVRQFRDAGYTAKFFSQDNILASRGVVVDTVGYERLDGSLAASGTGWWDMSYPLIDLLKQLLHKDHPEEADAIIHSGIGYIGGGTQQYFFLKLLRQAIEQAGAKSFSGQAFYDTAVNFKATLEGYPEWGFSETRRYAIGHSVILEYRADVQDVVKISDWLPLIQ